MNEYAIGVTMLLGIGGIVVVWVGVMLWGSVPI